MKIIIALLMLCVTTTAFAASTGFAEKDLNGHILQGGAPNSALTQALTVVSTTVDMSGSIWWSLYTPNDCKFRITPTSAKDAFPQDTAVGGGRTGFLVNRLSPFVNFSGCTNAVLQRQ